MSRRTSQGRQSTDGAEADLAFALPLLTKPMEAKSEARLPEETGPWQYEPKGPRRNKRIKTPGPKQE
jgi:ATP-dependent DNA ligase